MDVSLETSLLLEIQYLPPELVDIVRNGTNANYLAALSVAALEPHLTELISTYLEPLSTEFSARWTHAQRAAAAPAFGRILAVMPHLFDVAQQLFQSRDEDYDLLSTLYKSGGDMEEGQYHADANAIRELLLSVYRLLRFRNEEFANLIRPAKLQVLLHHPDRSIGYLTIRLICLYVHASDAVMEHMISKYLGPGEVSGAWEGKMIDYRFLTLWEEKRIKDFRSALQITREKRRIQDGHKRYERIIGQDDLSPCVVDVCGVLLWRSTARGDSLTNRSSLVPTATTITNLRQMAESLLGTEPILLTGLPGSGKTTLVQHLASVLNKSATMVTLHLNEQSDAKLLIGIYTTGSQPGSFQWQPGVLTTAVMEGRWVLIEDLDRAPNEVMSTILPLIERRELLITSRGETIRAAPGFKIIATMRSHINLKGDEVTVQGRMLGQRLWRRVTVQSLRLDEIEEIIAKRHPLLTIYMPSIIAVYQRLRHHLSREVSTGQSSHGRSRPISVRELYNWCARLSDSLHIAGVRTGREPISEHVLDSMLLDAVDCFTGSLEDDVNRDALIACIAEELHVDPQRRNHLLRIRTPTAKLSKTEKNDTLVVGRATLSLPHTSRNTKANAKMKSSAPFSLNGYSLRLLEQVAVSVQRREPLLLVGETGIGKTTAIQHLAQMLGQNLLAINLSQQSESGDLLGGLKPVNIRSLIIPLKDEFDVLFDATFSQKKNQHFLEMLSKAASKGQWKRVVASWKEALKMVEKAFDQANSIDSTHIGQDGDQRAKRRKTNALDSSYDRSRWDKFAVKVEALDHRLAASAESFIFAYTEGNLVRAVRDGDWVLLDEINLATPDTLECLTDLLESGPNSTPSIMLAETGNVERVFAHPNFRIFAAMNPATDIGKKDLPMSIRSRFTEIYVNSPDRDIKSLQSIVKMYLNRAGSSTADKKLALTVTELYQEIQRLVREAGLVDGSGQRPHYSLRTLTRTLAHAVSTAPQCSIRRALYEGFSMCFFTSLNNDSEMKLQQLIKTRLFGDPAASKAELRKPLRRPDDGKHYLPVGVRVEAMIKGGRPQEEQYWLPQGPGQAENPEQYIVTPYVARNLRNLIRAASTRKHPILIQGPTSAGKTSMVEYLAKRSGNKFIRINNHEHTDLQEYLGSYVSTNDGRLVFQEGVLVQAVRAGHWVVLDELNLAPTDVLEALNRLLDDNRELLIPETQEIVRPHSDFMLFATQNPAGPYGGRKMLSRAFRNRFLELHFDDIPIQELNVILARRSNLPESWCGMIVEVYKSLSQLRQEQRVFEQNSFATLRDLFRWAFRGANSVEELADNGYMLLAEKVRNPEERMMVKEILEKTMSRKGVKIRIEHENLYTVGRCPDIVLYDRLVDPTIIWTKAMRRLFVLVSHAIRNNEAVLLVGETGCGKTTVCQMLARALSHKLHIVNAHQNTETGDLIGAQRPIRGRAAVDEELLQDLHRTFLNADLSHDGANNDIDNLLVDYDTLCKERPNLVASDAGDRIKVNRIKRKALFEWNDGSLIQAMRAGDFYLLDEISLAEDSVLERMNSVLDPQRSILLAEKGTHDSMVTAERGFQFFATMNPGGDFGKKELSPALRNRFTEIWVPHLSDEEDILQIVNGKLNQSASGMAQVLVSFAKWFSQRYSSLKTSVVSIRDILAWVQFINSQTLDLVSAVVHGAALVYIDTLGANPAALLPVTGDNVLQERNSCLDALSKLLDRDVVAIYNYPVEYSLKETLFTIGPFSLRRSTNAVVDASFNFHAPTTKINAMRVVRALQLSKPVLLEGNPGVGKTSIITAIAKAVGKSLTRINLSEQTDLMDLFGSDVPMENEEAGHFAWRDAPFLTAMKRGDWVLLDEMNLASQSVLEGLNACLDHRGEVYVAELDQTFLRHPDFRLFAAQNPHHQGGGRKGLPASFVNRFTVVFADVFKQEDLQLICLQLFPSVDVDLISKLVSFVTELDTQVTQKHNLGARGAPWEFNLRDALRWLQLLASKDSLLPAGSARDFYAMLFLQRFRTATDVCAVERIFHAIFKQALGRRSCYTNMSPTSIQIGLALLPRKGLTHDTSKTGIIDLYGRVPTMESLLLCVQQSWPVILVGSSGAGKSYFLNSLASLVGAKLETFAMNADIDATDLVGGYEQADLSRERQALLQDIESVLRLEIVRQCTGDIQSLDSTVNTTMLEALEVLRNRTNTDILPTLHNLLLHIVRGFPSEEMTLLLQRCNRLLCEPQLIDSGKFEWIDGTLIKALEAGHWLVLDNANFCSSAVLDRLNSLLEPHGSLIINEHCLDDGSPRLIKPHSNFRIFLTVDPVYGEVSRAMRNRAVELFLPPLEAASDSLSSARICSESFLFRYQQYITTCEQAASRTDCQQIIETASDMLSFVDMSALPSFSRQAEEGLMGTHFQRSVVAVDMKYKLLSEAGEDWQLGPLKFYENLQSHLRESTDFCNSQSIYPISNQPLVLYNDKLASAFDPMWLCELHDISNDLVHMIRALDSARNMQHNIKTMSRLQRSFASARIPHSNRESTYWVAPFLTNALTAFWSWVRNARLQGHGDLAIPRHLASIRQSWWDLFWLSSGQGFEEAVFQVHLQLVTSKILKLDSAQTGLQHFVSEITKQVQGFHAAGHLTTGLSMEILWNICRPAAVPTMERLTSLIQLEHLADQFDQVVWQIKAPVEELCQIRKSIASAIGITRMEEVDVRTLITDLEDSMTQLLSQGTTEDEFKVKPFFQSIFEGLCQYEDLTRDRRSDLTWHLSLLAGRSTKSAFTNPSPQFHVANTLDSLVRYDGYASGARSATALSGQLPFTLLQQLAKSGEVPLRQQGLLHFETATLGRHLALSTEELSKEQIELVSNLLSSVLGHVLDAHRGLWGSNTTSDIESGAGLEILANHGRELQFLSSIPSQHHFRPIAERYFKPLLPSLYGDPRLRLNHSITGDSLIRFALGCLLLYVPNRPFDPALKARVERDLHDTHYHNLCARLETLRFIEQHATGDDSSLRYVTVKQQIDTFGSSPTVPAVARPPVQQLDALHVEFANILRLTEQISQELSPKSEMPRSAPDFVSSISRIVARLKDGFRAYEDLTSPIVGFLSILELGLRLQSWSTTSFTPATQKIQSMLVCIPFMNLYPETWSASSDVIPVAGWKHDIELQTHLLRTFVLRSKVGKTFNWTSGDRTLLIDVLDRFYINWKARLTKEQEEAAASTSLYTYRGSHEDEEEGNLEEFNQLFPEFDDDSGAEDVVSSTAKSNDSQKLAATIANLHFDLFGTERNDAVYLEDLLKRTAQLIGRNFADEAIQLPRQSMQQLLPAIFLALKDQINSNIDEKPGPRYNIYTDPNVHETKRLSLLIGEIQTCFKPIAETWPEHATLHNIQAACNELLALRHAEPVMKIIIKAEKLHDYIAEWQTVASKEFSANVVFNKLTDLLISWRQLELSTWARLLDLEMEKCEDDAKSWWFIAYENVIIAPQSLDGSLEKLDNHTIELVAVLETFLNNSAAGQYEAKLQILRSLEAQLRFLEMDNNSLRTVRNALSNFLQYFERFVPQIASSIAKGRKDLEKQVQNIIQLATWKDRNINALKQSAKSSHKKLFRAVKKFRVLLSQPAAQYLHQDLASTTTQRICSPELSGNFNNSKDGALSLCQDNNLLWHNRPVRFRDVGSTLKMMRLKIAPDERDAAASSWVQDFIDNLSASMEHLQKATPSLLTEENKSLVKHLTTRKRKLFTDTLKGIREMGIKSNLSTDVLAMQNSLSTVLTRMPVFPTSKNLNMVEEAQALIQSILGLMPTVRAAISDHNEDLQQSEIVRSVGYLEGLLSNCLRQRRNLASSMTQYQTLESAIDRIEALWTSQGCQAHHLDRSVDGQIHAHTPRIQWLPTVFRVASRILTAQAELGKLDLADLVAELDEDAKTLDGLHAELINIPTMPIGLVNLGHLALNNKHLSVMKDLAARVTEKSIQYPHAKLILDHLQRWASMDESSNASQRNGHSDSAQDEAFTLQYKMLDSFLGSVQDVAKAKQQPLPTQDEPLWLVREDAAQHSILNAFHADTLGQSIEHVLTELSQLSSLQLACASLTAGLPIIQQYQVAYNEAIKTYAELHAATCRLTYKLAHSFNNISKQGFCKPAEKSDDKTNASDKLESGTGLGEGEGAEDISKDIGADEDLSELAQDQNNKQPEHDIEKNADAVDIQDEFEGAAGDETGEIEDEEGGDKDGASQSGEEGEDGSIGGGEDGGEEADEDGALDEDVGSVDDLGPSAVDEKLWDQAGDEDKEEKEGTQPSKNVDDEEQAAGKDDAGKQKDDEQDDGQDGGDVESGGDSDDDMSHFGSEAEAGPPDQEEAMDPRVKETEALELPEDMQLDGDKSKQDEEMDTMSDEEMLDKLDDIEDEMAREEQDDVGNAASNAEDETSGEKEGEQEDQLDKDEENPLEDSADDLDPSIDQTRRLDDRETANFDDQPGGGDANDSALDKSEQQATEADARGEAPEDDTQDQTSSASNAQRKTGAESQSAERTQAGSSAEDAEQDSQAARPQESKDRQNLRKLGNILEKWHRQQQEIREAAEPQVEEKREEQGDVDMADAEFEHLGDEEKEADTQALGASSKEQARALDESMAVESTNRADERPFEDFAPEDEEEDVDEDGDLKMDEDPSAAGQHDSIAQASESQTFVGPRQPPQATEEEEEQQQNPPTDSPRTSPTADPPPTSWQTHEHRTATLSQSLTEHLRLILAPTLATKLRGDHRTGKRLNIKRIIPYIASQYKRDKIWMRRGVPSKRAYQVMLAIDDSKSMAENGSSGLAFDTVALVAKSLSTLEVGEIGVVGFGADVFVAHEFGVPFTGEEAGAAVLRQFSFAQTTTDVKALVERSIELFREARVRASSGGGGGQDLWQLQLIISDGICEDHEGIRRLLLTAREERIMIVFVIVDAASPSSTASTSSITELEKVEFIQDAGEEGEETGGEMKLVRKKYLDTFPFGYYLVVRDVAGLPSVLAGALRQWFAEVAER